ncbi:bifunctional diaminohydroxyphosphoribosylaminopyrimidine deaminase/5-amino-6-(5-phosphoribosylamino)uracil reductase RibD [Lentibacter algarum]|uniref:bifunctional diaminohydroxyphosphoribosylaminopyrimidine deaminase/5-amino-6-(5-phosphoribosylamino)uracil reductase RibD n=1 Tax=Lentibacter algarum TaxID=576131 RepID=UPI001C092B00|nr:bifunctional diaminohydroxyphosphoribosylaminopyrimidine deaminase/5-amino-6-(5-phosphoribosylamino)uracil reductase RibD [Lentibacter algarum]MBU2983606.1 bifunctional diaminohydroxyphosphoribosylaminopyrimidine deaminase/5-amino-6-(5-phosphoribosylamino)uracil reductase RibD [Lentibacter algarum]
MRLALSIGRRGMGQTWPNPAVGCVLVKDGRILARAVTATGGRPHAEVQALAQAGAAAKGATAYVTLEPCSHIGETPACSQALIDAGIVRVVAPFEDNDSRVSGRGFGMLQAAGIEVTLGICAEEAAIDHAGFFLRNDTGRPFVTLKLASSFDGRIATATGESQWITGEAARKHVHGLRASHDAVMVGGGTARADDPMLNVRGYGARRQPVRVVVSRRLDLPMMSKLAASAKDVPLWLCHAPDADKMLLQTWQGIGATCVECSLQGQQLDVASTLQAIGKAGLTRVFCEGGGALAASLLKADLVDELVGYTAGLAIGAEGLPAIGAMGLSNLSAAPRFKLAEQQTLDGDVMMRWRRASK